MEEKVNIIVGVGWVSISTGNFVGGLSVVVLEMKGGRSYRWGKKGVR